MPTSPDSRVGEGGPVTHCPAPPPVTPPQGEGSSCRRAGPGGDGAAEIAGAGPWGCGRVADNPPRALAISPPAALRQSKSRPAHRDSPSGHRMDRRPSITIPSEAILARRVDRLIPRVLAART